MKRNLRQLEVFQNFLQELDELFQSKGYGVNSSVKKYRARESGENNLRVIFKKTGDSKIS